jgi:hypothetical protein
MKVVRLSALYTGRLYPRKYSWYSFLLEAESTPGPELDRKDYVNEKFQRMACVVIEKRIAGIVGAWYGNFPYNLSVICYYVTRLHPQMLTLRAPKVARQVISVFTFRVSRDLRATLYTQVDLSNLIRGSVTLCKNATCRSAEYSQKRNALCCDIRNQFFDTNDENQLTHTSFRTQFSLHVYYQDIWH